MEYLSPPPDLKISQKTLIFSPKSLFLFKLPRIGATNDGVPFRRAAHLRAQATTTRLRRSGHDVVVVGAGIIGLSIARQLLLGSDLSVAVVDAGVPCSGATGAGQGYIWMAHKTPASETWELAMRSKYLWEELAESLKQRGLDPLRVLGWKKTVGSLLIGRTMEELVILEERIKLFSQAGLTAEFLSSNCLTSREPDLYVGKEGGAALFPEDCQLDAFQTVSFIEEGNKSFVSEGRYTEFYNDPAICILRSGTGGEAEAVQTSRNILHFKKALVIAAGAWSGSLLHSLFVEAHNVPELAVKPRKGYLILLENFNDIQLNHGLMEIGYIGHQLVKSDAVDYMQKFSSISMTATTDMNGNFVLELVPQNHSLDVITRASLKLKETLKMPLLERVSHRKCYLST